MNKDNSIFSVYSDARAEYTKQLCIFLVPAYFQFYIDVLERTKEEMKHDSKKILWQFQNHLNEVHDWNMEKVNNEINRIHMNCGCDYLDDLLTAVFIAHTKVLTAIRVSSNNKKVDITIPKVEHFLFKVLCETSKLLWGSTYLFRDGISGVDKQQNYRTIETILNEGIFQAVRSLVPVKSILRNFINNEPDVNDKTDKDDKEDKNDSDDENETSNISITKNMSISTEKPSTEKPLHATKPLLSSENSSEKSDVIVLDRKPSVTFSEFNPVFDSEHPEKSGMSEMLFENDTSTEEIELEKEKSPVINLKEPTQDDIFKDMMNTPSESISMDDMDDFDELK